MSSAEEVDNNDVNIENSVGEDRQSVPANSQKTTRSVSLDYSVCKTKFCIGLGETDNCVDSQSCELLLAGMDPLLLFKKKSSSSFLKLNIIKMNN